MHEATSRCLAGHLEGFTDLSPRSPLGPAVGHSQINQPIELSPQNADRLKDQDRLGRFGEDLPSELLLRSQVLL